MGADLFAPSDVPKMVPVGDFRGLDLTPEEGFLLSRIDGRVNVGALLTMVAWDRDKTMQLLESLLRKHLLNFDRAEIANRVFGTGNIDPTTSESPREASATPGVSITLTPVAEHAPEFTIDPSTVEEVPDLDKARCIEILTWARKVEAAENLYQLFEIPLGADAKSVKRQYRQMAMTFHPDKFFRKDIGGYRGLIERNWKRVQEGYELLSEPDKKAAYDADVLAKAKAKPRAPAPAPAAPAQPAAPPPRFTPAPPPPARAPAGQATATPEIPPWDPRAGSPAAPPAAPRMRVETAFERKLKAEVGERLQKARRQFDQAKADFAEKRFAAADSNAKLAMQFDPRNEDYKAWYESVKKDLEEGIVTTILRKAEMAEVSHDLKVASEEYEKALALFPENPSANLGLGKILALRGAEQKRARDCLQKGLNAKPNDLVALLAMCKVLRESGMVKNAARFIEKARTLAPKDPRVLEELKEIKKATK